MYAGGAQQSMPPHGGRDGAYAGDHNGPMSRHEDSVRARRAPRHVVLVQSPLEDNGDTGYNRNRVAPTDALPTMGNGSTRSTQRGKAPGGLLRSPVDVLLLLLVTAVAMYTRLRGLDFPSKVVFDEVHFGKFASYYLQHRFFFDVHPPLGKMLIALFGWCTATDPHYKFDTIGEDYPDGVSFYAMRFALAMFSAMLVPVAYLTVRGFGGSVYAAVLGSSMVAFEVTALM